MAHVSLASSWPMTLRALGGPGRSQSKCHTNRAPSISHAKEECPCTADGKAGWVPTVFHLPTRTSNCFSELVGCGGRSACSFMFIPLVYSLVLNSVKLEVCQIFRASLQLQGVYHMESAFPRYICTNAHALHHSSLERVWVPVRSRLL